MTKIVIYALHSNSIKRVIHNLTTEQAETVMGGIYPPGIDMMNITDSTYLYYSPRQDRRYWAIGAYSTATNENKYNSIDYSRSIYNRFI
ncbi:hypothetical protein [Anabaena sp. CCY 9614]|uniref:hypothetical protein n=1 Tax=Anabaena sp. CCY 9614 TaxID=3103869 RepID=UPI0039C60F84